MASTTPRYLNSTISSAYQQYSPSATAPPMKKQRATGTPNAAASTGSRNDESTSNASGRTTEMAVAARPPFALPANTGQNSTTALSSSTAVGANPMQIGHSANGTNTAGVIRPHTSHSLTMSSQVREAVKSRREELRKLQEQNKYTRSIVFPPTSKKQQILSLAKAQLASGPASTLIVSNGKTNNIDRISTTVVVPKNSVISSLTANNKENAASERSAMKEDENEPIKTPSKLERQDITAVKTHTNTFTAEASNSISAETSKNGSSSDANDSRAQVFQTMMKNADILEDGDDRVENSRTNETVTLRLLTELKKSKMQNEEELHELKETVELMTNNVQQAPEATVGMLLFEDDATVTSVRTLSRNKGGSGLGIGSLMSPIRPTMITRQQQKNTSAKGESLSRTSVKRLQKKNTPVQSRMVDTVEDPKKEHDYVYGDNVKQCVEQAIRVAVQRFTSAAGNEYLVACVSPMAENADTLEYYYTNILETDHQNSKTSNTLLSKLATDELDEVVSTLISLFHKSDDTAALAALARYIRVYAFIQADQSILLVKHNSKEHVSTQVIHWNGHTGNVLREYNLTAKDTQSHQRLKALLGNFPFIDAFGREREYQLSEIYREAMVVQRDFLTSIASTTWAFLQTSSSTSGSSKKNDETKEASSLQASAIHDKTAEEKKATGRNIFEQIGTNEGAISRTADVSTGMLFEENHNSSLSVTFGSLVSPVKPVSQHPLFNTAMNNKSDATAATRGDYPSTFHGDKNHNLSVQPTGTQFVACNRTSDISLAADLPQYVEQAFCVATQRFTSTQGNEYEIVFRSPSEEDYCKENEDPQQQPLGTLSSVEKEEVISSMVCNMISSSVPCEPSATESAFYNLARYIRVHASIKADKSKLLLKHQQPINVSGSEIQSAQVQIFHFQSTGGRAHFNLESKDLSSEKILSEILGRIIYIDAFGREQEYNLADVYREAILVQQHFLMGVTSSAWAFYRKDMLSSGHHPKNHSYSMEGTSDESREATVQQLQEPSLQQNASSMLVVKEQENHDRLLQPTSALPIHTESTDRAPFSEREKPVVEESKKVDDQVATVEKASMEPCPKVVAGIDKKGTGSKFVEEEAVDTTFAFIMLLSYLATTAARFVLLILVRIPLKIFNLAMKVFLWTCIFQFAWLLLVDDSGLRLNQYSGAAGRVVSSPWPTIPILRKMLHDLLRIGNGGDIDNYHDDIY